MANADTLLSLADALKINDVSIKDMGMSNIFHKAPLLPLLAVVMATNGTQHKYLKESSAPVVGFRAVNTGIDVTVGGDTVVTVDLKYMDATARLDKALAEIGKGVDYQMSRQGIRNLREALYQLEVSVLNGGVTNGFNGLAQALANTGTMCISAGGTAAGSGDTLLTSVYAIRTTDDETNMSLVLGNDGNIKMDPYYLTQLTDANGKQFNGYVMPIDGWASIQLGNSRSIARLANISTQANKTLTDAMLSQLFDEFSAGEPPTMFVMNRRSRGQLQRSRTAIATSTNKSGTTFADIPTEHNGVPIVVVESLTNNETLVAAPS